MGHDRLGVAEASMLLLDTAAAPFAFAACIQLDGAAAPALDEVKAVVRSTIHLHPRNRQVPHPVPLGLHRPVWVDVPTFDVDHHVTAETLSEPSEAALRHRIATFLQEPFTPGQPLWRNLLLHGLPNGTAALLVKVHHCMTDGVGGVGAFGSTLALTPEVLALEPPVPWSPAPTPTSARLVLDALRDHVAYVGFVCRLAIRALRAPVASGRQARRMIRNARANQRILSNAAGLGLVRTAGPRRAVTLDSVALADLKAVRAAFGCTVNDVLLALAAGAVSRLLQHRGESNPGTQLTIACPVSTRRDGTPSLDNQMSYMTLTVPLVRTDPVARLRDINAATEEAKAAGFAEDIQRLADLARFAVPFMLRRQVERFAQWGTPLNVSNVVGPPMPVWMMGARIVAFHGIGPLPSFGGIVMVCASIDGAVGIGTIVDPDAVPDLEAFGAAFQAELALLLDAAAASSAP